MINKDWEKELENYFTTQAPLNNVHFHRLPDSYSARGRRSVPAQPADFQFILPGGIHFYIEAKDAGSQNGSLFKLWKLSDSQYRIYKESVEYGYNYLTLNLQRATDTIYLVPAWLLHEEEQRKGDKTLDLNEIAQRAKWIVLKGKSEVFNKLLFEPNMRHPTDE